MIVNTKAEATSRQLDKRDLSSDGLISSLGRVFADSQVVLSESEKRLELGQKALGELKEKYEAQAVAIDSSMLKITGVSDNLHFTEEVMAKVELKSTKLSVITLTTALVCAGIWIFKGLSKEKALKEGS